jgi:peptide/nickel transport system substrate-binding protein
MKRFSPLLLAAASLWLLAGETSSARPRYGGTLRIATPGLIRIWDPAVVPASPDDAAAARHTLPLVFETLVEVDPTGGLRPHLASSWTLDAQGARWRIRLRDGVRLHDGSTLDPTQAADSLRVSRKDWRVSVEGTFVVIESELPAADVPWALADPRAAIAVRRPSGEPLGTGPFRMDQNGASHVILRAHDDYWGGRAFLDAIEIDLGRTTSTLLGELELGRIDMAAVQATDRRRLSQRGLRTVTSRPLQLFALVFEGHRAAAADDLVRQALASTLDRSAICRVLLQDYAEPADALLPRWLSGYELPVLSASDRDVARTGVAKLPPAQRALALRVDAVDPVARVVAERIAVDAREAGLLVTVQAPTGLAPRPDVRLLRIAMPPSTPDRALAGVMSALGPRTLTYVSREPAPPPGAPLSEVYRIERSLIDRRIIVPVAHVPEVYGLAPRVDSWNEPVVTANGTWNLADVWLRAGAP